MSATPPARDPGTAATRDPGTAQDPGTAPAAESWWHGRGTVQGWFHLVLGVMALLVLVFAVVGAQLLSRTGDLSDGLADRVQPARVQGVRLQTALLDQETGVRGYVLTHNTGFLQPYLDGTVTERTVVATLRPLISGNHRATADLAVLEDAAAAWRADYATPLIAHAQQGRPAAADAALLDGSKRSFDRIRELFSTQDTHLQQDRMHGKDELRHVETLRDVVFLAMLGSFLAAVVVLALLLRQIVGRPLGRLRDDALRVASGDFEERIRPSGPADLRVLAQAVEAMRSEIAGALAEAHGQRAQLALQAEELTDQARDLRRSNEELEQFAYVASHDLQEPLRKVASFCQLLEKRYRDQLDDRGVQYIDFAVDGAKRMQVLINDLLAFSRVGRAQDDRLPVRLDTALDSALRNLAGLIEESGAEIRRPDALPETVGDPTLLTMVWQNLLGNAVKFRAPDRPPLITVETGTGPDGSHTFSVTDNGIGIAPEFSEKVFVIFQRLHTRDVYEGTGIGLAMCRKIIEHHGGRISVDDTYDRGTRIVFSLPAHDMARHGVPAREETEGAHTG